MQILESIYYLGLSAKKFYAVRRRRRLPCRVISIGNLTVGGTGKTPAAIAVAREAQERGYYPVILTRGYGGKADGPCFVTKGEGAMLTAEEAGDEPVLMARGLKGVPVVKGNRRYEAGIFALKELGGVDGLAHDDRMLFILDDGFQHWGLYRDKDIVLIDAGNPFGSGTLLPFGRLREPVSAIARSDIVVITKTGDRGTEDGDTAGLISRIRPFIGKTPVFLARHMPVACRFLTGNRETFGWIAGKKVFGFCGLANPSSFKETLASAGARLAGFRTFRDHYRYTQKDLDAVAAEAKEAGAGWIATTEKDIMRTGQLALPENILIIEIVFSVPDAFYEAVFG